jgi:uncharacterized protein
MARMIIVYALVILAFLGLYFLVNFYLYLKVEKLFHLNKILLASVLAVLALSFIAMSFLVRKFDNPMTKSAYFASATWLGIAFFLLICFLIADGLIFLSGIDYRAPYYCAIGATLIIVVVSLVNASSFGVREINLKADVSENLKIVQISDVHLGPVHSKDYLQKIVDKTNSLEPDFVFITGDLFDGSTAVSKDTISPLEKLKVKRGVYFVTGNHETYIDESKALNLISADKVKILRNQVEEVDGVQIIGANYPSNGSEKTNSFLEGLSSLIDKDKFSILLYHPPVGFDKAADAGVDLQLSGHTHNGQIFPFNLLSKIFYNRQTGLYSIGNSHLYVSQGAGTWGPPMRFLSKSEIVLINVKKK